VETDVSVLHRLGARVLVWHFSTLVELLFAEHRRVDDSGGEKPGSSSV
jgi:hypothetical protein